MTTFESVFGQSPLDPPTAGAIVDALLEADTATFRGRQTDLLRRYRRSEVDQEPLSVALMTRIANCREERCRRRLEETRRLLEHVHDPLIG
jgi:hypothetical protein